MVGRLSPSSVECRGSICGMLCSNTWQEFSQHVGYKEETDPKRRGRRTCFRSLRWRAQHGLLECKMRSISNSPAPMRAMEAFWGRGCNFGTQYERGNWVLHMVNGYSKRDGDCSRRGLYSQRGFEVSLMIRCTVCPSFTTMIYWRMNALGTACQMLSTQRSVGVGLREVSVDIYLSVPTPHANRSLC